MERTFSGTGPELPDPLFSSSLHYPNLLCIPHILEELQKLLADISSSICIPLLYKLILLRGLPRG